MNSSRRSEHVAGDHRYVRPLATIRAVVGTTGQGLGPISSNVAVESLR